MLDQGHYTNILRGINSWIRVDDTHLHHSTLFKSSRENSYIIFLQEQNIQHRLPTTRATEYWRGTHVPEKQNIQHQLPLAKVPEPFTSTRADNSRGNSLTSLNDLNPLQCTNNPLATSPILIGNTGRTERIASSKMIHVIESPPCQPGKTMPSTTTHMETLTNTQLHKASAMKTFNKGHQNMKRNDGYIHINPIQCKPILPTPSFRSVMKKAIVADACDPIPRHTRVNDIHTSAKNIADSKTQPGGNRLRKYTLQNFFYPETTTRLENENQSIAKVANSDPVGCQGSHATRTPTKPSNIHVSSVKRKRENSSDHVSFLRKCHYPQNTAGTENQTRPTLRIDHFTFTTEQSSGALDPSTMRRILHVNPVKRRRGNIPDHADLKYCFSTSARSSQNIFFEKTRIATPRTTIMSIHPLDSHNLESSSSNIDIDTVAAKKRKHVHTNARDVTHNVSRASFPTDGSTSQTLETQIDAGRKPSAIQDASRIKTFMDNRRSLELKKIRRRRHYQKNREKIIEQKKIYNKLKKQKIPEKTPKTDSLGGVGEFTESQSVELAIDILKEDILTIGETHLPIINRQESANLTVRSTILIPQ
ncbi:hypothetical protein QAD02_021521 [Eretmocerus hayati]|uniref:Uncharacterized protein n=1 Tax=Eretmocerus hayati TaxID=131215 RepID=A0ACC2PRI6_9HYME|nr:hypothetical protein QAD02_021521 [Eretmocerus hayati]